MVAKNHQFSLDCRGNILDESFEKPDVFIEKEFYLRHAAKNNQNDVVN